MSGDVTVGAVREAVVGTRALLGDVADRLWQAGGGELGSVLEELDALEMACGAAKVAVVAEALERGETSDGAAALTPVGWVRAHAPSTLAGGARQLVDLAVAFGKPANQPIAAAVQSGRIPLRSAAVVVTELDQMRPRLAEGAEPHVLTGLLDMAAQDGPRGCRRLRPALLARYGLAGELQGDQDSARRFVALSQPFDTGTGIFEYRLALDTEGKTVLEAALGPLSAPRPVDGEPDLRGADRRRGDALISLVRRAVASPDGVPTAAKAQLFVTVDYDTLRAGVGAGTTVGGPDAGTVVGPETVRRIACDADLLPMVLGTDSQVMDLGHTRRLFTPGQVKRLWLRDRGCTYPAAPCRRSGPTRTTWSTGPTEAPPTWPTPHCCANATTPPSTPAASAAPSPPEHPTGRVSGSCGTPPAAATTPSSLSGSHAAERDPAPQPVDADGLIGMDPQARSPRNLARSCR